MEGKLISSLIASWGYWPLITMLVLNLLFRRYGQVAINKRIANLYHVIMVFLITSLAHYIVRTELNDMYLFAGIVIVVTGLILLRRKAFPYRRTCVNCNAKLDIRTMYFMDDNLCVECHQEAQNMETQTSPQNDDLAENRNYQSEESATNNSLTEGENHP